MVAATRRQSSGWLAVAAGGCVSLPEVDDLQDAEGLARGVADQEDGDGALEDEGAGDAVVDAVGLAGAVGDFAGGEDGPVEFAAGWTTQALHRQLTNDTANAQSITGLYLHRLAQLPDARTAAAAAAAEETYTPPKYQAQPAPDAVPPNQAIAAARAAQRAQTADRQHGRDRQPYIPARP